MAKLTRVVQKIFGSTAAAGEIGVFGSLAAGAPATTTDPTVIQSLSNFLGGWFSAVLGSNSPAIEDMNAVFFLITRQLAYHFQAGIPEWESGTTYYKGSLINSGGVIYSSLTDDNTGNALANTTHWKILGRRISTVTGAYTATLDDDFIRADATAAEFTVTLPAAASSFGKEYRVKAVSTNGNNVTVKGAGTELLDQANTFVLHSTSNDSITVISNGTTWDIV